MFDQAYETKYMNHTIHFSIKGTEVEIIMGVTFVRTATVAVICTPHMNRTLFISSGAETKTVLSGVGVESSDNALYLSLEKKKTDLMTLDVMFTKKGLFMFDVFLT